VVGVPSPTLCWTIQIQEIRTEHISTVAPAAIELEQLNMQNGFAATMINKLVDWLSWEWAWESDYATEHNHHEETAIQKFTEAKCATAGNLVAAGHHALDGPVALNKVHQLKEDQEQAVAAAAKKKAEEEQPLEVDVETVN